MLCFLEYMFSAVALGQVYFLQRRNMEMQPRLDYGKIVHGVGRAMSSLDQLVRSSNLASQEPLLIELAKIRASQINLHTKTARSRGETEQRIYELVAWREAPYYTERERAALAWAEAVTLVSVDHVPDEVYAEVRKHFSDEELVYLTLAIISINGWNRLAISFRTVPE